jgi:hypothetical protein
MWIVTSRRRLCAEVMVLSARVAHKMEWALSRSTTLVSLVALEKLIKAVSVVPGAAAGLGQVLDLKGCAER